MDYANLGKIPNLLRKYRKVKGLKEKDVARLLGLRSPSRISRWEKGACLPSLASALRLAGLYGVMVDALFSDLSDSLRKEIRTRGNEFLGKTSSTRHDCGE